MATKKSLFSKPKWAAPSASTNAPANDTPIFQQNIYEDARRAQRKYEEEQKLKEKAAKKAGQRKTSPAVQVVDDEDGQPAKKRRKSSQHSDSYGSSPVVSGSPARKSKSREATGTPVRDPYGSLKLASPSNPQTTTVDSDDDLVVVDVQTKPAESRRPARPATPDSDSDPDEDPYLKELKRKARAEAAARTSTADDPVIALRVKTLIPNCEELYVKRKASQTLSLVFQYFTEKNNIDARLAKKIFFTWNETRLYNSTTLNSVLTNIKDKHGTKPDGSSLSNDMIEVEAVTEEIFQDRLASRKREREQAMRREMGEEDEEPVVEEVVEKKVDKIVIHLKPAPESGLEGMMLRINPDTPIDRIVNGYMRKKNVPQTTKIYLMFDGEVLEGDQTADEVGFENDDAVDVRVRDP